MSGESALLQSEWRQGAVLPHSVVPVGVLPESATSDTKLVVISHDCDLVHPSYEAEPFVEFFVARPMQDAARDGRLFHGKNPRRFQFFAEEQGKRRLYEIDVHEKYRTRRESLEAAARDSTIKISASDVQAIAKWAARRHHRPSLPTAFLNRVPNAIKNKLAKRLEKDGEDVVRVLIGFNTLEELETERPYRIVLRIVIRQEIMENDEGEQRAIRIAAEIRKLLSQCNGIDVEDADVAAESEVTLYELRSLMPWDFDYLSPEDSTDPM